MKRVRALLRNSDANVAMLFALSLIPITIAAGAGLDLSRAMIVKTNLTEALDAASLAVASNNAIPANSDASAAAQAYFNANYTVDSSYGTPVAVTAYKSSTTVTASTSVPMPTTLMGVAGIHTVDVTASSTVVWGQTKLWVSLVLDNTGSMCQTDSNPNAGSPCPNAPSNSKIVALKTATHQLLTMLQGAAANPGDVQVAIIPFSKTVNVGTSNAGATWIDWTDWDAAPPSSTPSSSVGPGSNCPYSWNGSGYACAPSAANDPNCTGSGWGSDCVSTIPTSGLICPSVHATNASTGQGGHYYNGCYDSVPTKTKTTTQITTTPMQDKQTCRQTGSGPTTCADQSGYPKTTGNPSVGNPTSVTTNGYTGDSGPTPTTTYTTSNTQDGSKSCTGQNPNKACSWTRTLTETKSDTTVTATGAAPYNHTWHANDHTTWTGCIMDRQQSNDVSITAPTGTATNFPAENSQSCVSSVLGAMGYDWATLGSQIDAMQPNGSTNQTIGLAWGWQAFTGGDPLNAPTLPPNTSQFIILVSDGLNTQDRFGGDGLNQSSTTDARMALACTNAKAAGIVIYTVFVDLGGTQGNSTVLRNCATDTSKYFDLTTSNAIITTLNQIGQQITNLHVSQ
ncbi:MAG: TadE/TadG family type IV pilus assembly protein [Rhizomicrobium sp.]